MATNFPNGVSSYGVPLPSNIGIFSPFGSPLFVNGNNGSDGQDGKTPQTAFKTMGRAFTFVQSLGTIVLVGQIKEQLIAPLGVSSVTIIGGSTRPRYGNEGSFANPLLDYAAAWRPPTSPAAATPLITLRQQGWKFQNILFDAPADAACIMARRQEDAVYPDASSFQVIGCQFSDGLIGIQDLGGAYNYLVDSCIFRRLTRGIYSSGVADIAIPLMDTIQNCIFQDCTNGIQSDFTEALIQNNVFMNTTTATIDTSLTGAGARNFVINNYVSSVLANINPAGGFHGSATDIWRTFASATATAVVVSPPA